MTMTNHAQADRLNRVLRKYGITEEQYHQQLDAQVNRCPLCGKTFSSARLPAVEHRHKDGLWRGLTCVPCNFELGAHHDDAGWFARAALYLQHPPTLDTGIECYVPGSLGEYRGKQ